MKHNDGSMMSLYTVIFSMMMSHHGKEEKPCLIFAFSSLNSSELDSEEFNDENKMMSPKSQL